MIPDRIERFLYYTKRRFTLSLNRTEGSDNLKLIEHTAQLVNFAQPRGHLLFPGLQSLYISRHWVSSVQGPTALNGIISESLKSIEISLDFKGIPT